MFLSLEQTKKSLQELQLLYSGIVGNGENTMDKDPYTIKEDLGKLTELHSLSTNYIASAEVLYKRHSKDKTELGIEVHGLRILSERLNNSIGKTIDTYRSMLSFQKLDYEKQTRN
jgi:hypothetical protein